MSQSIQNFKSNFFGGTRKNRFEVTGNFPYGGAWNKFQVYGTQLPQNNLLTLEFDHVGRKLKLPGDRVYGVGGNSLWTVLVLDDNNQNPSKLWQALHGWSNTINNHTANTGSQTNASDYKASVWTVSQLNLNCNSIIKQVKLYGCWPVQVGEIELDERLPNEFVTFQVAFSFDYAEF